MVYLHRSVLIGMAACLLVIAGKLAEGEPAPSKTDYQESARSARWSWHGEQASPLSGLGSSNYDVSLLMRHGQSAIAISILKGDKNVYSWSGHHSSVFRIVNNRLFYADFRRNSTGGKIVAVDLASGKELWRTPLEALGQVQYSAYSNLMNLQADEGIVTVYGWEGAGKYIEIKDAATGRTVGHKIFPRDPVPVQ